MRFKLHFQAIFVIALTIFAGAAGASCDPYLRTTADGLSIGVQKLENLKGVTALVSDVSDSVRERKLPGDKRINVFKLADVFAKGRTFLGFGHPNVFLGFPPEVNGEEDWNKFAAKSFKRADSKIEDTRGFAQSGILLVFKDLSPEKSAELYEAAKKHEGTSHITCVNANCRVMEDAGFTVGGEAMSNYILPGTLLEHILRYGLELNGEKIEYDIIRVNADVLEQIGMAIDKAVGTTLCRHAERSCDAKSKAAENILLVYAKKGGRRVLNLFLGEPKSPKDKKILEAALTRLPPSAGDGQSYSVRASEPSELGTLLRMIWSAHTLVELSGDPAAIQELLPSVLEPFPKKPGVNQSLVTRIKKFAIFSPPVVSYIVSQLAASYREFNDLAVGQLFDMIRTDGDGISNKYNIVVLGDRIVVMKVSIKMKIIDWILSKHLILSGYSKDVRFAGEFYKTADGAIHLTRNSGTYQPSPEQLRACAELLRRKFPGVTIVIDEGPPA